ncbi:MAG TPA: hypothetical protein VGH91_07450 [Gammaproteobacteria bacterium]|jgi:hypothetical protein
MNRLSLSAAIALSLGVAGFAGAAHADDQPITGSGSSFTLGDVKLTLGGFIEAAYVDRSVDELADVGSKYAPIWANKDAYYLTDNRLTARQSRLSLLAQGPDTGSGHAEAYYEGDFLGAAVTANSTESNSYTPRIRQVFTQWVGNDGFTVLGGQAWSLVTQDTVGITARKENSPLTIDAQYVPGFNWTRTPQFRFVEKFSDMFTLGLSVETPQTIFGGTAPSSSAPGTTVTVVNTQPGGSLLNSTTNYSLENRPDLVLKAAFDPGWGHYEVFDLNRSFQDRVDPTTITAAVPPATLNTTSINVAGGSNDTTSANSWGVNALLPLIPKTLDLTASYMSGQGIGRYGSAQLPDVTFAANGSLQTLKGTDYLVGLIYRSPSLDLYGYDGAEKVDANYTATGNEGYGNPAASEAGCLTGIGGCASLVSKVSQYTVGGWWKIGQGEGHMAVGLQYSHTSYDTFADAAGNSPSTSMNVWMVSYRYYMFN